ncbi:hypothetical protein Syun_014880 [Stephania yunnanensis]|uniref:Protein DETOXIFICATION n=1 Tax=Stephania yunnanensis TaxID=152371 RepID=A0AAP0PC96_9MAGN
MENSAAPLLLVYKQSAGAAEENRKLNPSSLSSSLSIFASEVWTETKLIWYIAGPTILTTVLQFSLGFITQSLVGHLGTIELAAVGIQTNVIGGIGYGVMMGMGSALETLCGQAYGAGRLDMMGIYMQRSWLILMGTALVLTPVYVLAAPILKLLGQNTAVADLAGKFSLWMLPELYGYALNFPTQKFLQAQSKVMPMTWISLIAVVFHGVMSWVFIYKLGLGLVGAAIILNLSFWFIAVGQIVYVVYWCNDAWSGLSWLAFCDLGGFVVMSIASGVMICLEYWTYMLLIILAGLLKNAELQIDAATICMNLQACVFMIPLGFLAASSVRVSNELGAGHPRIAKFSVWVMVAISVIIQITCTVVLIIARNQFPVLFTDDKRVIAEVSRLIFFLSASVLLSSIQPILSGLAIGAGWQTMVAFINIGSYYLVGMTVGCVLGFKFNFGLEGLWGGVIIGIAVQTVILLVITLRTNWEKQAALAKERITNWGGSAEDPLLD